MTPAGRTGMTTTAISPGMQCNGAVFFVKASAFTSIPTMTWRIPVGQIYIIGRLLLTIAAIA